MTTGSLDTMIEHLRTSRRVLIATHVHPDGDAVGSSAALAAGLGKVGIHADILLLSQLPPRLRFVYDLNQVRWFNASTGWPRDLVLDQYDTFVSVDTGTWSQLPGLEEKIASFTGKKLVIDHHLTQQDWADDKWVVTSAAAAAELVYELLQAWPIEVDAAIGLAIYTGLAGDTGWFEFSNTTPKTLRLAAQLMEQGVDVERVYRQLYQSERISRIRLMALVLSTMQIGCADRLAILTIRQEDLELAEADETDTENFINLPLQVQSVQVSVLIYESRDGQLTRVSLRSKGQLDVAAFAQRFGGGGHARAAGLKLNEPFESARRKVIAALVEHFSH